jgi:hypothetical protein
METPMSNDFEPFFEARQKAASAYVAGDGGPVDALVPHDGEASFHSPGGVGDAVTPDYAGTPRFSRDGPIAVIARQAPPFRVPPNKRLTLQISD